MYVDVFAFVYTCVPYVHSALRGTGSPGTGVIGGNELPNMDAES